MRSNRILTVPNIITFIRLGLLPVLPAGEKES